MEAIWASLIGALVKYQLPLAAGLGTWFTYLASKQAWFQKLGDWGKKAVVGVAAFLVVLVINALGGQVSADLQGLIDAVLASLLGGGVAAAPVALAYRFGRVQPSFQSETYPPGVDRRGTASIAVILALASLGLLAAACGPALQGAQPGVGLSVAADTIVVSVTCDADAPNVACLISVTDSATGAVLASQQRVTVGQTVALAPRFCAASGPVAYFGTFVAVTASGKQAPAATGIGRGNCDLAGGAARPNIQVQIRPGGL